MLKREIDEKKVKEKIKGVLKKYGVFYFMPFGSLYGKSGVADFICCVRGHFLGIEAKSSKAGVGGLTPLQKKHRDDLLDSGGEWICVHDDETLSILEIVIKELSTRSDDEKTV